MEDQLPEHITTESNARNVREFLDEISIFWLIGILLVVIFSIWFIYYIKSKIIPACRNKPHRPGFNNEEVCEFFEGSRSQRQITDKSDNRNVEIHRLVDGVPYDKLYEFADTSFSVEQRVLGSGEFGLVLMGKMKVAVKTVKPGVEKIYLKALLNELKILIFIGKHENIVNLHGAYTGKLVDGKAYLFLEYCAMGSLHEYLVKGKSSKKFVGIGMSTSSESVVTVDSGYVSLEFSNDNTRSEESNQNSKIGEDNTFNLQDMLNWSIQLANALRYLSTMKVIHGDIATRNILLCTKTRVKLTDFGLSRRLYKFGRHLKKSEDPLPWRWMAIEALRDLIFSTQSDVWSFGVTLWEIYSLGSLPFESMSWSHKFVDKLEKGLRLQKPPNCDEQLYELMTKCCHLNPSSRPSFMSVHRYLIGIEDRQRLRLASRVNNININTRNVEYRSRPQINNIACKQTHLSQTNQTSTGMDNKPNLQKNHISRAHNGIYNIGKAQVNNNSLDNKFSSRECLHYNRIISDRNSRDKSVYTNRIESHHVASTN